VSGLTGEILWEPPRALVVESRLAEYIRSLERGDGYVHSSYRELWRWSIENVDRFWSSIWDFFDLAGTPAPPTAESSGSIPRREWFPTAQLNYAERALAQPYDAAPALIFVREGEKPCEVGIDELRRDVGALAAHLQAAGVRSGDCVVGYLNNSPHAVVSFLACASIGAVWSACSLEAGVAGVVDRLSQLEPVVFIGADGYRYAGKKIDRRAERAQILASLNSVRHAIFISYLDPDTTTVPGVDGQTRWEDALADDAQLHFCPLPFDHPLWILYSSGTTGLPKGIVHGHGGIVLEELKALGLHLDIGPRDRFLWYTSTSWAMWNILISGLLLGATVVLYDGSPSFPHIDSLWRIAATCGVTVFGTSAAYLLACQKADVRGDDLDLDDIRTIGSTGSPLPASAFRWVYDALKPDVWLASLSGGTEIASAFAGGCPLLPVRSGELQTIMLGVAMDAWNERGESVVDQVGELVVTKPMPSMPVGLWGDADGSRYRETYLPDGSGIWRHGDWITITGGGGVVVHGRSDATINRQGVRLGSAEIYQAVEAVPGVRESLVVGVEQPDGGYWMPLFVALDDGVELDERLRDVIVAAIRERVSQRYVPDELIAVPAIPHTLTGKKLEVPVKRLLQGGDLERVVSLGSVDDPDAIAHFAVIARSRARVGEESQLRRA
jgi:acetoacetyl-CoA synthetase